eukprot:1171935-Prymnesium_polylepis.1
MLVSVVCSECEPVPTSHVSFVPVARRDVEEIECGAVGAACLQSRRRTSPAAPRPPPRPLTRPCP